MMEGMLPEGQYKLRVTIPDRVDAAQNLDSPVGAVMVIGRLNGTY